MRPTRWPTRSGRRSRSSAPAPPASPSCISRSRRTATSPTTASPGSFYTSFLPWQADLPGAEDRLIADIEERRVKVIVLDQEALVWDTYKLSEYAPKLYAHIMATYRPIDGGDRKRARLFVRAAPWP